MLLEQLPAYLFEPLPGLLFWAVVLLVLLQYNRAAERERRLFGLSKLTPWREVLYSLAFGVFGGLIGSMVLVYFGVILDASGGDFIYLWVVSLLLAMWHPRYICFAYSGGLIGLSYLVLGWPRVNIAAILALVAILHLVESLLIWMDGASAASPLMFRREQGDTVAGFSMQRFWPVPLAVLLVAPMPPDVTAGTGVAMPDWWPLLPVAGQLDMDNAAIALFPVVAGLGFTDVALARPAAVKGRGTAGLLLLYSIVLLGLAVAGAHNPWLLWAAVLFSPLAHEGLILFSQRRELSAPPLLSAPDDGVRVLDVVPGSPAAKAGLATGAVITEIEGTPVRTPAEFREQLRLGPVHPLVRFRSASADGAAVERRVRRSGGHESTLGLVLVPDPSAPAPTLLAGGGLLRRLARNVVRRLLRLLARR